MKFNIPRHQNYYLPPLRCGSRTDAAVSASYDILSKHFLLLIMRVEY